MERRFWLIAGGWLLLLAQTAAAGPALVIDRAQVNVRADATVQSERIAVLRQGAEVEQLDSKDEWRRIRLSDGREGWVHSVLVREQLIVTGDGVRIRAAGSVQAPTVAMASRGEELGKLGQRGNWSEVGLPDGRTGWIWSRLVRPKEISITPAAQERQPAVREESPPPQPAAAVETEPAEPEKEEPAAVRRNSYAEGLQQAAAGDYRAALASFEEVLRQDPDHLNALIHVAQAHKQLGNFDPAREKLYRAMEIGKDRRDIFMTLGEVYRLSGEPDSARKYQALFRGEEWVPKTEEKPAEPPPAESVLPSVDVLWIYGGAALGASAVLVVLALLVRSQKRKGGEEERRGAGREGKFARTMRSSAQARVGSGEEAELDRQIQEKRAELRESAATFLGPDALGEAEEGQEDGHLEHVLNDLEALRKALEMQDERARIYADLVRLQSMKIEMMSQELQMRRRRT